jgi:uncharacterized cupin superfamily protein
MLDRQNDSYVTEQQAAERLDIFGAAMIVLGAGGPVPLFVGEHRIPPGYGVPPHIHEREHECFFMLQGALTLMTPSGDRVIGPGDFVQLPAGGRHGFRNETGGEVRFLVIAQSGVQALEMFRHLDRAGRAAAGPLPPAEIEGICAAYGVSMG